VVELFHNIESLAITESEESMTNKLCAPVINLLMVSAFAIGALLPAVSFAQAPTATAKPRQTMTYEAQQERINAWTVGLAAGRIEGAPLRLASEMARVVDDGPNMQVLPIVTRGPTENVNALLYLKGVDLAIINADVLEEYKVEFPEINRHISYLFNLFPSELHVLVRPEIQSLQDLAGKKVNFNTLGTAAAYSGPLIFSRLGINIEKTFIPHQVALQQLRKGEIAAVVFITAKPVDAFTRGNFEHGFKFLPVPYDSKFEDYYLPAVLGSADYPALIKAGDTIGTIAVPTALVAYSWTPGTNRYQRVARFVDYLFSRVDKLQAPGFDPQWRAINLSATVPGLNRYLAAQEWLERKARRVEVKP
jgi:TRAP-type uncharacterized transport system substrate-binding protein